MLDGSRDCLARDGKAGARLAGLANRPVRRRKGQHVVAGSQTFVEQGQQRFQLAIQMQDHLAHQRRIGAHFIAQQGHRIE